MSSSLGQEYHKLAQKFLDLSLREQILIAVCGTIVVTLLIYTLLLEPLFSDSQKVTNRTVDSEQAILRLSEKIEILSDKLADDPNNPIREKIALLKDEVLKIDSQLEAQTNRLVPANKMAKMLETVLTDATDLSVVELQSIPPIPILLEKPKEGEEPQPSLYRHGVTLVVEGTYFNIQRYLEKLESLEWQFYWKKFDYSVNEYPLATVELEIYTLSTNKAFIGV